ncbi:DUF2637 domain-containing protein [Actinomadura sp. LD22]|uniref:DUF2637 domain-containing protein n=1 Tax=Actinomadura physcomitrii TaxID=2650748 RepID=A0A6I4M9A3_9ACTN|nr:DUF2637 domain-containing protein [Actinomadura physcomitrii]MWA02768.1 DUF2637 domain-containing protein [Actinomadura physcomitrii]
MSEENPQNGWLHRTGEARQAAAWPDRLAQATTALAVIVVAGVAATISYAHILELTRSHGEKGLTARLVPVTVDGLIWAASMVVLDAGRRSRPVPALARWSLAAGIVATVGANVAHGAAHGVIGALVSAWPALALIGSFELLMTLIRNAIQPRTGAEPHRCTTLVRPDSARTAVEQTVEQAVLAEYRASLNGPGRPLSQRYLADKHGLDRRKVKQIISAENQPRPDAL